MPAPASNSKTPLIIRRLKTEIGALNNFVNILGPKSTHKYRNSCKFAAQRNRIIYFDESLCRETLRYASLRSILHM